MRKSTIKRITCALSVFLITGILNSTVYSAADNTEKQIDSSSWISSEPITLNYFCALPANAGEGITNLSELEFYKDLEKDTNIKIKFIHASVDSLLQKYTLMMAAGDLPDIVELPWIKYSGALDRSIELGAILKLDSLLQKNAPNLNEVLRLNNDLRRNVTSDDGAMYQFPSFNVWENSVNYQPMIRGDLLKKNGLEIPETLEDWENVLKLFKQEKLIKSPLSFDLTALDKSNSFIGAFGITKGFYLNHGRVVFGPIEKSYKDLLTTLSRWYKNGLLDHEFIVLKNTQIKNKVNKGDVGAFIGTQSDMADTVTALKALDPAYELIPVQNPVLNRGDKLSSSSKAGDVNLAAGIAITRMNKNPVETVKWLDYAYNRGIKAFRKYDKLVNIVNVGILDTQGTQNKPMPLVSLTQKETEEVSKFMMDINTFSMEMFAKFVLGVEPLDKFDTYVGKVRSLGIDRVIQINQAALYRYNNRLAADRIKVIVNGSILNMDTNPIIINGRAHVPVRSVIEALGGSVDWNEKDRSVSIIKGNVKITLKINSADLLVNNINKSLDGPILLLNDRTYVSVEFMWQNFVGVKSDWNETTRTVNIEDKQN